MIEDVAVVATDSFAQRRRILLIEDSALVVMVIEEVIEDLGWDMIGPATRLGEALHLAKTEQFDAALVDVNLDGEMSWPVAEALRDRGIPFVFTTGYDGATVLPEQFAKQKVVNKPFTVGEIEQAPRAMTAGRSAI